MRNLTLINLLVNQTVYKWIEEIEEADENGFVKGIEKYKGLLTAELNEKQIALLNRFNISLVDNFNYCLTLVCAKLLNLGIKIGMEMQTAFEEM